MGELVREISNKTKLYNVGMTQVTLLTRKLEEAEARREKAHTRGNQAAVTSILLTIDVLHGTRCRFIEYALRQDKDLTDLHRHFKELTGREVSEAEMTTGELGAKDSDESEMEDSEEAD